MVRGNIQKGPEQRLGLAVRGGTEQRDGGGRQRRGSWGREASEVEGG